MYAIEAVEKKKERKKKPQKNKTKDNANKIQLQSMLLAFTACTRGHKQAGRHFGNLANNENEEVPVCVCVYIKKERKKMIDFFFSLIGFGS